MGCRVERIIKDGGCNGCEFLKGIDSMLGAIWYIDIKIKEIYGGTSNLQREVDRWVQGIQSIMEIFKFFNATILHAEHIIYITMLINYITTILIVISVEDMIFKHMHTYFHNERW